MLSQGIFFHPERKDKDRKSVLEFPAESTGFSAGGWVRLPPTMGTAALDFGRRFFATCLAIVRAFDGRWYPIVSESTDLLGVDSRGELQD